MAEPQSPMAPVELTEAQRASRRKRSIALGLTIGALCILFYMITVFKMGAAILVRPM